MTPIRVLLAEDHETVRQALRMLIDAQPDMSVVGEVADGAAAVQRGAATTFDVVVMDLSMPGMNGLVATRELKHARPDVRVVALTRHDDEAYVRELLAAGASGFVLKRSPSTELLAAIRAAAAGKEYLDTGLGAQIAGRLRGTSASGDAPRVSDRENDVLRLMAVGHSNKDIADQLGISIKTVEVHKANAMKKLGFRGRIDVVRYAIRNGWLRDV